MMRCRVNNVPIPQEIFYFPTSHIQVGWFLKISVILCTTDDVLVRNTSSIFKKHGPFYFVKPPRSSLLGHFLNLWCTLKNKNSHNRRKYSFHFSISLFMR